MLKFKFYENVKWNFLVFFFFLYNNGKLGDPNLPSTSKMDVMYWDKFILAKIFRMFYENCRNRYNLFELVNKILRAIILNYNNAKNIFKIEQNVIVY